MSVRIAAVLGALRKDSFNRKLLALAKSELERLGAEVDVIDLKQLVLPIYDGDLEAAAFPATATELKERLARSQAMLFVSPEYNFSIPGGLKNAIDWASRPSPVPLFRNRVAAIMGVSGGPGGTMRMQPHLRDVLGGMGSLVLGGWLAISAGQTQFTPEAALKDERFQTQLKQLCVQLFTLAKSNPLAEAK